MNKDGGSAFPIGDMHGEGGMSLRDYFAAHAPEPPPWWLDSYMPFLKKELDAYGQHVAQWRWVYADQMLKEREK